MKVLAFSDSHGNRSVLSHAVALEMPGLILHLGDHDGDCSLVEREFPEIPLRSVRGNCDYSSAGLDVDEFTFGGKRFFMAHGHLYNVKIGFSSIINAAARRGADVLLFGHTHVPYYSVIGSVSVINPGSIAIGSKTYAVLEFKDGDISCEIKKSM